MAEFNNIKELKTYSKKLERENKKNENTLDSTKLQENKHNDQIISMTNTTIPDESSMKQMGNDQASKVFAQFGQDCEPEIEKML